MNLYAILNVTLSEYFVSSDMNSDSTYFTKIKQYQGVAIMIYQKTEAAEIDIAILQKFYPKHNFKIVTLGE